MSQTQHKPASHLRYSWIELLFVLVLTGTMLFFVAKIGLRVFFKTAGIRPGVRFLNMEVGGLGPVPAKEYLEKIVDGNFRFPLSLELGDTTYFLYRKDHFDFEVDFDALIEQARALGKGDPLWERTRRHISADFQPVDLPWNPVLDREFSAPRIAKLIEDHADNRSHAFLREDGMLRIVVSNSEDQVKAVLDALEELLKQEPKLGRRVFSVGNLGGNDSEIVVAPQDPEHGFRFKLAEVETALDPKDWYSKANVATAAGRVHSLILNPDEEFDFGKVAGPFQSSGNYRMRVVEPNQVSSPDGETPASAPVAATSEAPGVERVGTALFQALLRAGASLVDRSTHTHFSEDLKYVPLGLDVRLFPEGKKPAGRLLLKNEWDFPLQINLGLAPDRVVVTILGLAEPPVSVDIRVGVPEKVPYKTQLVRSPKLPRGKEVVARKGLDGYRVKIFRKLVRKDGVQTQEKLLGEAPVDYAPLPSLIMLGTGNFLAPRPRDSTPTLPKSGSWGGF